MKPLADRTTRISTSQTVAIDAKYKLMKSQGLDVLSLGAGEPDLDTPQLAKNAAIDSIQKGFTKYSAVTGLAELKQAISEKFGRENNLDYAPENIIISGGAKHCVFNTLLALVQEGDEVLIPIPYWTTYPELVKFLGGKPILISTTFENGFKVTASELKNVCTERTKILILNSPVNPTGSVYSEDELAELAKVVVDNDLYCLSDEIYEHIVYGAAKHNSIASLGKEIFDRTITINGMSKAYAMTGWRIGFVGAPGPLAKAIAAIQSHGTHHPANASQYAALACLREDKDFAKTLRDHLNDCRTLTLNRLQKIPGIKILDPDGAFYAFFGIEAYLGKSFGDRFLGNSLQICEFLLDQFLVATVPGTAFGLEGFIRISFANNLVDLDKALIRMEQGLLALK